MEFKGTKGSWEIYGGSKELSKFYCDNNPLMYISMLSNNLEENEANLILISKAPDLLEMLKRSIQEINHLKYTYKDSGHCCRFLRDADLLIIQATQLG